MSRVRALRGASAIVVGVAQFASSPAANAQDNSTMLPPVTVQAPHPTAKRPVKRPPERTAGIRRRQPKPTAAKPPQAEPLAPAISAGIDGGGVNASFAAPPVKQRFQLPQESYSITAKQIEETINLRDPEDAVKYMPDLFVRKRNDGDNQAVLATRTWGLNSSARTLIYYDDLLVSALINNNNQNGSPHWNLISPDAIARVDFLDGPFAAAYPGNSLGGVLIYTSKMPDHAFATAKETVSVMPWNQYGTKDTYTSSNTTASAGNRIGAFSWLLSVNYQDSWQQPLTYTTSSTIPAGTTGAFPALNKQGLPANVIGTGTLAHSQQTSANLRLAYDVTPFVQATYSLGIWNNHQTSSPQTYLTSTATGQSTFAGNSTFASNRYIWDETHLSNAISLKSDTKGIFDFDLSASSYNYLQDVQLNPFTGAPTGIGYSTNGKITRMDGTNWQNADAKGIWRPFGFDGPQEISFGLHGDRYDLENPTYASAVWNNTPPTGTGLLYSDGEGETRTGAVWLQDAWKIEPNLKLTLGGRLESWEAINGYNLNTTTSSSGAITSTAAVNQPNLSSTNFSPKASLSYDPNKDWNITANFGEAYRYPTVAELYQNITVNGTATVANPYLTPEQDINGELNIERHWSDGRVRLTVFDERTNNAIISQTNYVTQGTAQYPVTTVSNVGAIRMQGVELSADKNNVLVKGLQLFGSVTYVDSRILSDPTFVNAAGQPSNVIGKRVPYVPDWRATFGGTYRPNESWVYTIAARFSGKQYSTLDNTDVIPHVFGAFDNYVVVDMKVHYNATQNLAFDFGIDNIFNEQYFLYHPFPGRTFVLAGRYTF